MNICTKFHGNPSDSYQKNGTQMENIALLVALEVQFKNRHSQWGSSSGEHEYHMTIHQIAPKWWIHDAYMSKN